MPKPPRVRTSSRGRTQSLRPTRRSRTALYRVRLKKAHEKFLRTRSCRSRRRLLPLGERRPAISDRRSSTCRPASRRDQLGVPADPYRRRLVRSNCSGCQLGLCARDPMSLRRASRVFPPGRCGRAVRARRPGTRAEVPVSQLARQRLHDGRLPDGIPSHRFCIARPRERATAGAPACVAAEVLGSVDPGRGGGLHRQSGSWRAQQLVHRPCLAAADQ